MYDDDHSYYIPKLVLRDRRTGLEAEFTINHPLEFDRIMKLAVDTPIGRSGILHPDLQMKASKISYEGVVVKDRHDRRTTFPRLARWLYRAYHFLNALVQ